MLEEEQSAGLEVDAQPSLSPAVGALVVGGDHPALAIARSLGRHGVPVYLITDQPCIASVSRYATRVLRVADIRDERKTVDAVLAVEREHNLRGWVLIPTRDETIAAFSRFREELEPYFAMTTGAWESVQWAWDKKKTYELAESLGIPCPKTFNPQTREELAPLVERLPLAMKPAVKENFFYATGAKAWRADTPEQLCEVFDRAIRQIRPEEILMQEIIPGGGQEQYSYCAFVEKGEPHSILCARRLRQHPREFGRAATYVESVDAPEIEEYSARFLRAIRHHGLVEIEYKRDPRDGQYKLLDVNARAWGFHGLGPACGVDFAWMLFADRMGLPLEPVRARPGVGWLRLLTDIPTALSDWAHGTLTLREYFRSLRATGREAVFDWKDPLPAMAEIALLPYSVFKKYPLFGRGKA